MSDLELQSVTNSKFQLNTTQLRELNVNKDTKEVAELGGIKGIASKLRTEIENGLGKDESDEAFASRSAEFGKNELIEPPIQSLWSMVVNALKEPILILLLVAAIVSILFGLFLEESFLKHKKVSKTGWIEGVAIMVAVFLVVSVSAGNDYSKEKKFRALNKIKNDRQVKVRRAGTEDKVSIATIQVGDVVILGTGDQVPADGLFIDGHDLAIDESSMTGEPDAVKKTPKAPFLLSGCQVTTGTGSMLVTAVGMNSEWGVTYSKLIEPREQTPLQEKLESLAKLIGYVGMGVAALLFIVLTIEFIVKYTTSEKFEAAKMQEFIRFIILCISIVVVAVPEGLPLAVTIALAYSMKAMLKDKNLVRHLAACETMGGATNICSDKTGTLTENLMTVTNVWMAGNNYSGELKETLSENIEKEVLRNLATSCCINSNAFLKWNEAKKKQDFIGSTTECALLVLADKLGYEYGRVRKEQKVVTLFPFSSDRKRMSTVVAEGSGARLHCKGASEIILGLCSSYVNGKGKVVDLSDKEKHDIESIINELASNGLRTLSIAYKDLPTQQEEYETPPEDNLTLLAIVGIKDPLRAEVPAAIELCKLAGITVRMVTGDNKLTATKIATDCGILQEGMLVMEGPDFRKLSDEEVDAILPKLRVLARSSPTDKHRLVTRLKFNKEVVAVTGDGTNDAPALKAADVGMAMGIAGTETAKEASDVIIMDDNFASIVKAVMWGRSVRQNIQKFLQFQMTINAVALIIAFVSAVSGLGEPLTAIQLLWVNLIQDTFAALALATEKPTEALLYQKPTGRHERLITPTMWRTIFCNAFYECFVLFWIVYYGHHLFNITEDLGKDTEHEPTVRFTIVFNTFVYMATFNEINSRRLDNHWNAFERFFTNYIFLSIIVGTALVQIIIIEFGGVAFRVVKLNWKYWLICVLLGISTIPFGVILRTLVPAPEFDIIKYQRKKVKKNKKVDVTGNESGSDSSDSESTKSTKKDKEEIVQELP